MLLQLLVSLFSSLALATSPTDPVAALSRAIHFGEYEQALDLVPLAAPLLDGNGAAQLTRPLLASIIARPQPGKDDDEEDHSEYEERMRLFEAMIRYDQFRDVWIPRFRILSVCVFGHSRLLTVLLECISPDQVDFTGPLVHAICHHHQDCTMAIIGWEKFIPTEKVLCAIPQLLFWEGEWTLLRLLYDLAVKTGMISEYMCGLHLALKYESPKKMVPLLVVFSGEHERIVEGVDRCLLSNLLQLQAKYTLIRSSLYK